MGFLSEHLLLVLTIVGAAASFLATLLGLVSEKRPVMILALLACVGFVVGIAYQLEVARRNEAGAQIKAAAEAAQAKTLQAIDRRVTETQVTVEAIADRLKARSWAEVGSELVTIQASGVGQFDETMVFAKGPPDEWRRFAGWLEQVSRREVTASLSLTLRPGTHYDSGLLLAYLLTSPATQEGLKDVIGQRSAWRTFPAEQAFVDCFSGKTPHLKAVLLYQGGSQVPAAYADARAFSQQLVTYHRLGRHAQVDAALNGDLRELQGLFPMLKTSVFPARDPAQLARSMIEQQLPVAVTTVGSKPYIARLERMVQLATK